MFVDIFEDGLDGYDEIKMYIDKGLSLPLISIDNKKLFYGGLSNNLIYDTAKGFLK